MENLIVTLAIGVSVLATSSVYFIRVSSRQPANGEVKRLQSVQEKLCKNVHHYNIVETQKNHYVKLS